MKKSDRILALKFSELYENEKNLYRNAFDKNDIILWELTKSHDSTEEAKRDKTSMVIVRNRTLDSLDAPDTYDLYKVTLSHDNAVVLGNEHIKTSGLVEAMQSAARYLSGDETMLEMDDEEWEIVGPNNKRIDLGTGGKIWNSDKVYGYDSDRDVWVTTVNVDGKSVPVEIDNYFSFGKEDEFLGTGEWTSAIKLNGVEFNIVSFQHEDPDTEDAFGIRVRSHRNLDQDIPFSRIDSLEGEKFREYNAVKTFEIREIKGKSIFARRAMLWQGIGELIGENLGIRAEITDKNPNISVIKKQQESLIQDPNVLCEKIKDTEGIALNPGIASDVLEYAFRNNEETGSSRVLSFDGEKLYDYDAAEYKTLEEAKKENHAFETSSEKILEDAIIHISEVIAPAYPDNDYSGLIAELEEEKENIRKIKIMNEFFGRNYKNIGDVLVKDKEYWGEPHQELSEKERKELAIKTMAAEDFQTALIKNKSLPKELRNEDYTENELHTEFMDELLSGKYKTLEEAMKAFAEEWKKENSPRLTPNGKESSLSKEDYEYAHSDEFRERFGDWEKAYRLEKIKDAEPISVEGNLVVDEIDLTEELPKLQSEKMRGFLQYTMQTLTNKFVGQSFHNEDKNINIKFNRRSVREIQKHDYYFLQHIEAIPYVPQIIGKAIYIGSQKNNDRLKHPEIKEYMYFATGIKIRGEDYTCKSAVSVDNENNYYYDQTLSTIEKGKLVDEIKKLGNLSQLLTLWETEPNESIASHNPYDIRLLDICQCPQMKFLGENFEPTKEIISKIRSGKTIRDFAEQSANQRIEENGIYFEENVYRDWSRKEKRTFDDAVKFIKKEVQRANTYQIESVISELLRKTDLAKRIDEPDWDANSLAEEISASPYEKKILIAICDNNNTEIRKPLLLTTDAAYHFVTPEMFMDYYNRHKTESAKELSLSDAELLIRGYENGGDKSRLIIENDTLLQAEKTAEFFSKYRIRKISINKTFGRAIENYREKLGELLKDPDRTEQHSELQKDLKEKIQTLIAQQRTLLADVSDYHKLDSEKIIQKNDLKEGFKTTTQGAPSNKSRLIIAQHLDKVKNCDIEFTENFEPTSAEVDKAMETLDERKKNTLTPKEFAEFLNKANTNKSMKEVSESEAKLILDWNFPLDNRLEIRADGLYEKNIEGNTYKKEPEWIIKNAVESMKNQIAENKLQQASVEPDAYSADEANLAALKEIEHEFVGKDQFLTNSGIKGTFISIDDGMLGLYTEIWLELPEGHPALGDKEWTDKTKEYSRQSFDFATYADFKSDLSFDKLGEVTIRDHDEGINWPLAKPDSEYFSSKEKAEIIEEAKERFYQEVEKSLETFRTQMDFNGENIVVLNEALGGKLSIEPTKENIEILDNMLHSFESGGENLHMLKTDGFKKPGKIIVRKNEWMQDEEIENKPKTATERWENTYTIAYDLSGEEYGVFGTLDPEEFFSLALDSKFVKEKDVISGWLTEYQKNSYVEKINTFFKDTLEKLGRQPFENFNEIIKWDEEQYGKYDGAESEKEIIKKSAVAATATLLQEAINRDDMGLVPETIKNENYVESTLPKETAQLILYDAYRTLEDAIKSQFVQTEKENLKKNITARKDIGKIVLDHLLRSDDERIKGWIQQYIVETTMGNESQREDFEDYLREAETIDPDNLSEEQIKELLQKNVEEQDAEWLRDRLADLSDLDRHGFEADRVAESLSEIIPDPEYLRVFINGINAKEGHILDANLIEKVQELNIKDVEKRIKENQNDKVKFKVNHEEKTIEHWYFDDEETVEIPSVTVMKNSFDDFAKAMKEGDPYATLDVLASLSQDVTTVKQSEPGYLNRLQEYEKEEGDCPEFIYRSGNADEMKLAIQRVAEIAGIRTPETDRALLDGYTEKIASFLGRNEDDVRKDIGDFIADRDWSESEGPKDHAVQYLAGELRLELGGQANDRDTNCDLLNEAEACAYEVLDMERFSKSGTLRHLRNYAEFKGIMDVDKGLVRFSMDAENEKITHIYYSGGSLVKVENSADDLAAVLKDDPQGLRFIRNLRKIGEITTVQKGTPEYDELEKVYESVPISDFRQSQEFLDDYDGAGKREYINNLAELTEIVSLNLGENANSDTKFTLERFAKKHLDPSEDAINREIFFVMKEKRMIRQMYFDPHGKDGGKIFVNDCSFAMLADEAVKAKKSGRKFSHALTDTWNGTLKKYCSKGTADYILQKEVLEDKSILVDGDTSERLVADETMYRTSGQRRTEEVLENLLGRAEGVLNALAEEKGVDVPDGKTLPEIVQMAVEGDSDLFEIWKEKEYVSRARKYLADGDKNEKICSADVQFCSENEIGITVYPNTDSGGFEDLMGMKMEDWQNSHGIDDDAFDDRIDCCMNPDGNRAIYRVPDGKGGYAEKNVTDKVFKSGSPYLSAIAKELAEKYIPGQKAMHDKTLSDIKEIVDKAYQSNQKDYSGMHNEWSIKKDGYVNFTLKHQGQPVFAVRDNDMYIDEDKLRTLEVSAKSVLKTVRDVLYEKEDVMTPCCGMTETEYGPIADKNPEFGDVKTLLASELKARAVSATHSASLAGLDKKKFVQPRSRSDEDRREL